MKLAPFASPLFQRSLRVIVRHVGRFLFVSLFMVLAVPVMAASFIVNEGLTDLGDANPADGMCADMNGKCSLRAAIEQGNALMGASAASPHSITFVTPTVLVINGDLPSLAAPFIITGPVVINGTGNSSAHGCLNLTDSGTAGLGYSDGATGSTVIGLVIGNCSGNGITANGHGYTFTGNFIGVDPMGTAMPNMGHGIAVSASHVYNNVDTSSLDGLFQAFPSLPVQASDISTFSNNLATTLVSLNPVKITGNVISGNGENGIEIFSENLASVLVSTNMIGTDPTGNVAVPNGGSGLHLVGHTFGNLIGPNNVISGNTGNGIQIDAGTVYLPNYIMGNRIGLAATQSSAHIGNGMCGIRVDTLPDTSTTNTNPSGLALLIGPGNLISDNQGMNNNNFPDVLGTNAGILITGASTAIQVIGNTIGMAEFGAPLASKSYGNAGDGIIVTTTGNTIGGSSSSSANIIAANARHGIVVSGSSTTSNSILGNSIGVHPGFAGNLTLGNGVDGVHIDGASSTSIGGPGASDFNIIAGNGRNGLKVLNGGSLNGWSNLSQRNQIYSNAKLLAGVGIDLDHADNIADGPHDEFPNTHANLDQAPPVICTGVVSDPTECNGFSLPASTGGGTTLDWTLKTHGIATFRLEFFKIDSADDNTATSMTFLGEQQVMTDASGSLTGAGCTAGRCTATIAASTSGGYVLMTVTDITHLTNMPSMLGDWEGNLACFIGNQGTVLTSCNVNDTSEFSNVVNIPVLAPTVVTTAATAVAMTTATLNGTVSANGAATTVTIEYGATTAYGGIGSPLSAGSLAANASNAPVSASLTGLTCNTTYHFRVDANNSSGTTNGNDVTFTTAACGIAAPTVATTAATAVAMTTATLNGTVSSNNAATTVTIEYGTTTAYGGIGSPLSAGSLAANASNAPVSASLTGLTCNTTYHFRVDANNSSGTTNGNDVTFTTAACGIAAPTVTTTAATAVAMTTATLNGTVSSNNAATTVTIEYGTTTGYGGAGSPLSAGSLAANASNAPVSASLTGLTCNTTYHFRVDANNSSGTTDGDDVTFTTAACGIAAPTVTTMAATAVAMTTATLNGTVSSNNAATTVTIEYGTTTGYGGAGSPLSAGSLAANASNAPVSASLTGLTCNTTYHFRVDANNSSGTTNGNDVTFTTAACGIAAPTVTTMAATAVAMTTATLNGTVSANGASTMVTIEYGATTAYGGAGSPLSAGSLAANASSASVSASLTGLTCNTTYHFRVDANNSSGTTNGNDVTFTTAACGIAAPTVTTTAATAVAMTTATLNGTVSANGAATTVTIEYGATTAYGGAGSPLSAGSLAANASSAPVSASLTGLTCNTTYHFRVDANNSSGTTNGNDVTFTTAACGIAAPTVTTMAATAVAMTTATLNGTVSSNNAATTVTIEYGTTTAYGGIGSPLSAGSLAANASNAPVSASLTGLTCNTTYHFRVDANNSSGTTNGNDVTFTTAACSSIVTTFTGMTATNTGMATAVLSGGNPACSFVTAAFVGPPVPAPAGVTFPDGLFQFTTTGCGDSITVEVTFPTPFQPSEQYWKYGPTPGSTSAHWYTLGSGNKLILSGSTATFLIEDGGMGDDDLAVNDTIVDQGGPAVSSASAGATITPAPSLTESGALLLTGLLMLIGIGRVQKRGRVSARQK